MIWIFCNEKAWCGMKIAQAIWYVIKVGCQFPCHLQSNNIQLDKVSPGDVFFIINAFAVSEELICHKSVHFFIVNLDSFHAHPNHFNEITHQYSNVTNPVYLLDYQSNNIKFFYKQNKNPNLKIFYFPFAANCWTRDSFLREIPSLPTTKEIDVLMYGSNNLRREYIAEELRKLGYNVPAIGCHDDSTLYKLIASSKLVLNVYFYENNKVFDYYRLALLLNHDLFFVTEDPEDVDDRIEIALVQFRNHLCVARYDALISTVCFWLSKNQEERSKFAQKAGQWFRQQIHYDANMKRLLQSKLVSNSNVKTEFYNFMDSEKGMCLCESTDNTEFE